MSNKRHGKHNWNKEGKCLLRMSPKGSCAIAKSLLELPSNYLNQKQDEYWEFNDDLENCMIIMKWA
jgi:hypothetical protein